jgi:hypothetical protein
MLPERGRFYLQTMVFGPNMIPPRWLTNADFRLAFTSGVSASGVSANSVCLSGSCSTISAADRSPLRRSGPEVGGVGDAAAHARDGSPALDADADDPEAAVQDVLSVSGAVHPGVHDGAWRAP